MTLIVGIKCVDGVVIAADTAAEIPSESGIGTIHEMHKIQVSDDPCHALGVAGTAGLSQIYGLATRNALREIASLSVFDPIQAMILVRKHLIGVVRDELGAEHTRAEFEGRPPDFQDSAGHALIAVCVSGEACLYHYSDKIQGYHVGHESPYHIIGDGSGAAIPFLQYLRLEFLHNESPNITEGVMAALWTVRYAIRVKHRSVGGDVQMVTLSNAGELKELDAAEIAETKELIGMAEQSMYELKRKIRGLSDQPTELPKPPVSSSAQEPKDGRSPASQPSAPITRI